MPFGQLFHRSGESVGEGLLGIMRFVELPAVGPHGGELLRVEDGPLQNGGQLFRVVVRVGETIHPFGDETGGAGVFRHDGGFSEDEALGDEGGHRVVAGGADEAGTLLHQVLDLIPAEPLAVEDVGRVFGGQGADGVHHLLVGSLAHEEEGCFFPHGVLAVCKEWHNNRRQYSVLPQ